MWRHPGRSSRAEDVLEARRPELVEGEVHDLEGIRPLAEGVVGRLQEQRRLARAAEARERDHRPEGEDLPNVLVDVPIPVLEAEFPLPPGVEVDQGVTNLRHVYLTCNRFCVKHMLHPP